MHISVKRSGGYAGLSDEVVNLETSRLDPKVTRSVQEAIESCNFYGQPENLEGAIGADFFKYEVTITDAGRRHRVTFADDGQPVATQLMVLVNKLIALNQAQ
jgi:hypothetical protein